MSMHPGIWFDETHTRNGPEIFNLAQAIEWEEVDATHLTCCQDDDLALCGADVTGEPWADEDDSADDDCTVCEYLDAHDDDVDEPCTTPCPALRMKRDLTP